jgi:hypothetical protein
MPLRDHFLSPVSKHSSWEVFHGCWPTTMVMQLRRELPPEFTAEPRVHLGSYFEIDVCAYEKDEYFKPVATTDADTGGVATASWSPPAPTLVLDADPSELYEYEVLIYDQDRGRTLVAAVEIVSPANKDRPETRRAFVAKCAALIQKRVCVSIVDLVTTRQFNLYTDLLELIGRSDPSFAEPTPIYAATCRGRKVGIRPRFETWAYHLSVGKTLPTLPIWLTDELSVSLDLEKSYEEACWALNIP